MPSHAFWKIGTLGDQNILADVGLGFDHRITIQRGAVGNGNGLFDIDHIKNALETFFAVFHKIHDKSLGQSARDKIDVMVQFIEGMVVQKIELVGIANPHGSGIDIKMTDLAGLDVRKCSDDAIVHGCQIDGCKRSQKTPVDGGAVDIGVMGGNSISDKKFFQGFRVV